MSSNYFNDDPNKADVPDTLGRILAQTKIATSTLRALSPDAFRAVCIAVREVIATQPAILKSTETLLNRIYQPQLHEPPSSAVTNKTGDDTSSLVSFGTEMMAGLRSFEKIQYEISHFPQEEWALAAGHIMVQTQREALRLGVSRDRADMLSEQIGLNVLKMHIKYSLV